MKKGNEFIDSQALHNTMHSSGCRRNSEFRFWI